MSLYGQESEVRLLTNLLAVVSNKRVIDVGAELGNFTESLRNAGAVHTWAIEPAPHNVSKLRDRFGGDPEVTVLDVAASDSDGEVELHLSVNPDGTPITFGNTVLSRPGTEEISWGDTISVPARSLGSLVSEGVLPAEVGILKIDTEGHDLAVLKGIGGLQPELVLVEHWLDLPLSLGPCPWTMTDLRAQLAPRGFTHAAFLVHQGPFSLLQWDDARIPVGHAGNLLFLHDSVLPAAFPHLLSCASELARAATEVGVERAAAADERLTVIQALTRDRDLQARAASERLVVIEELTRQA